MYSIVRWSKPSDIWTKLSLHSILHSFPHQVQWPHWLLQALLKYIVLFMSPSIMNSGLDTKNDFMFWLWNVIDKKLWSSFLHYNEKLQYYQVNNQKIIAISLFCCCFPFTSLMVEIWLNLQIKVKCKCSQSIPAPPPPLLPLQHHCALFSCYNTHCRFADWFVLELHISYFLFYHLHCGLLSRSHSWLQLAFPHT